MSTIYKLILQKNNQSDQIHYNLVVSNIKNNKFGSNLETIGKYITYLNNNLKVKKVIIYKHLLNKWLAQGLVCNQKTEQLLKKAGFLL